MIKLQMIILKLAIFLYPLSKYSTVYRGLFFSDLLFLVGFVLEIGLHGTKRFKHILPPILFISILYVVGATASLFYGFIFLKINLFESITKILSELFPILVVIPLLVSQPFETIKQSIKIYFLALFTLGILNVGSTFWAFLNPRSLASGSRVTLFGDANETAVSSVLAIPGALLAKDWKIFSARLSFFLLVALIVIQKTASRTGFLILVLTLILMLGHLFKINIKEKSYKKLSFLILTIGLLATPFISGGLGGFEVLAYRFQRLQSVDANFSLRIETLEKAFVQSANNFFLIGIGPSSFTENIHKTTVHNNLLLWLVEVGILGFIPLLYVLINPMIRIWRIKNTALQNDTCNFYFVSAIWIAVLGIFVTSFSLPMGRSMFVPFYLSWAFVFSKPQQIISNKYFPQKVN